MRPSKVYSHTIGNLQSFDKLIFEEKNESYFVDINLTKNKKFLLINSSTLHSFETFAIDRMGDFI